MSSSVQEICADHNLKDVKVEYFDADFDITSYSSFRKYVFPKLQKENIGKRSAKLITLLAAKWCEFRGSPAFLNMKTIRQYTTGTEKNKVLQDLPNHGRSFEDRTLSTSGDIVDEGKEDCSKKVCCVSIQRSNALQTNHQHNGDVNTDVKVKEETEVKEDDENTHCGWAPVIVNYQTGFATPRRHQSLETAQLSNSNNPVENGYKTDHEYHCKVCQDGGDVLLMCDNCPNVYHLFCLAPKLNEIPSGRWFCPQCQDENVIEEADEEQEDRELELQAGNNSRGRKVDDTRSDKQEERHSGSWTVRRTVGRKRTNRWGIRGRTTAEQICEAFYLNDVKLEYNKAECENINSFTAFKQRVHPILAKRNQKKSATGLKMLLFAKWEEFVRKNPKINFRRPGRPQQKKQEENCTKRPYVRKSEKFARRNNKKRNDERSRSDVDAGESSQNDPRTESGVVDFQDVGVPELQIPMSAIDEPVTANLDREETQDLPDQRTNTSGTSSSMAILMDELSQYAQWMKKSTSEARREVYKPNRIIDIDQLRESFYVLNHLLPVLRNKKWEMSFLHSSSANLTLVESTRSLVRSATAAEGDAVRMLAKVEVKLRNLLSSRE